MKSEGIKNKNTLLDFIFQKENKFDVFIAWMP